MESHLQDFIDNPNVRKLLQLQKEPLISLASNYEIELREPLGLKSDIQTTLVEFFINAEIFPSEAIHEVAYSPSRLEVHNLRLKELKMSMQFQTQQ